MIVHELTHQWFGDDLPLGAWQDIWLNEGFATYAEWLWSEHEGLGTPQEIFDFYTTGFLQTIGSGRCRSVIPDPTSCSTSPCTSRGALTLHALRLTVGDDEFFKILQRWPATKSGENVTTPEFIRLAERVSHQDLDALFEAWLYTPGRPDLPTASALRRSAAAQSLGETSVALNLTNRFDRKH